MTHWSYALIAKQALFHIGGFLQINWSKVYSINLHVGGNPEVLSLCMMGSRSHDPDTVRKQPYLATNFLDTQTHKQRLWHCHLAKLLQHDRKMLLLCQAWLQSGQGWMLLGCSYYFGGCSLAGQKPDLFCSKCVCKKLLLEISVLLQYLLVRQLWPHRNCHKHSSDMEGESSSRSLQTTCLTLPGPGSNYSLTSLEILF